MASKMNLKFDSVSRRSTFNFGNILLTLHLRRRTRSPFAQCFLNKSTFPWREIRVMLRRIVAANSTIEEGTRERAWVADVEEVGDV